MDFQSLQSVGEKLLGPSNFEYLDEKDCERCKQHIKQVRFYNRWSKQTETRWQECGCAVLDIMEANQEEARKLNEAKKFDRFNQNSLVNPKIKDATFKTFITDDKSFQQVARDLHGFVSNWEEGNVLLYGSFGTGKSHLAISATKLAINNGRTALFISVPKLFSKIKDTYNKKSDTTEDELISMINNVDLLVLDDIGAESGNESWAQDKLFLILDGRQGKRTIYTTNLDGDTLEAKIGGRNYDRMADNLKIYTMVGDSHRRKNKPTW